MKKLSEILVLSSRRIFNEIIAVLLFSLISSAVLAPIALFLPVGIALVLILFIYIPLCVGVMGAVYQRLQGNKRLLKPIFYYAAKYYLSSIVFGIISGLFLLIIVSSWWYYGQQESLFYFVLAVFQTYFVGMFFISQLFTIPLLIQEDIGIFTAMGTSTKLFVANPLYSIGAFFQALCITLLLGVTVVGFAFLFIGMMSIYAHLLTLNVRLKHKPEEQKQAEMILAL